jgi:hypothetical protein
MGRRYTLFVVQKVTVLAAVLANVRHSLPIVSHHKCLSESTFDRSGVSLVWLYLNPGHLVISCADVNAQVRQLLCCSSKMLVIGGKLRTD